MGGTRKGSVGLVQLAGDIAPVVGGGAKLLIGKREIVWNARRYLTRTTKGRSLAKSGPCSRGLFVFAGEGRTPPLSPPLFS